MKKTPGSRRFPAPIRRVLVALAFVSLAASAHAAAGGARPPIMSGSELDYPPFAVTTGEGKADGFAVELMRAALDAMGHEVQFRVAPWHELKQDLATGRLDALPLVARTAARDEFFDFSVPYLTMHGTIVVRRGSEYIHRASDLEGREVLVMKDDVAEEYVREHRLTDRIVTTATVTEALQRLAGGEGDAVVAQKLVGQNLIRELGLKDLATVEPPLPDYQQFCFAVRAGNAKLLEVLNEGLALVSADGTLERLRSKWLGPVAEEPPTPWLLIATTTAATLLLAWAVAYLWQRSLARMVRVRTAELTAAHTQLVQTQALRESEERLRLAAEAASFGTYDFDLCSGVLVWSRELKAITGLAPDAPVEADANGVPTCIHPMDLERLRRAVETSESPGGNGNLEIEHRILRPDGSERWVLVKGKTLFEGEGVDRRPVRRIGTIVDITERKRSEEALERKTRELERMNAELEEFAYVASHDLKAPLRAVANLAFVIDEDVADGLDPENRRRLHLLRERVTVMDRLIDGLLAYARLGRSAQESGPVALDSLLREVIDGLSVPPAFQVQWEEPLPTLNADPLQLRQIFQNLITNAIAHHDRAEGHVWIRARDTGRHWVIEVADDGPGISQQARKQVFRMFNSGHQSHAGIGLAVVRKLVLAYGGQIELSENSPRGALFLIRWPKSPHLVTWTPRESPTTETRLRPGAR